MDILKELKLSGVETIRKTKPELLVETAMEDLPYHDTHA